MPATVHDLKTLLRSYHPVIAIESVEEERIRRFLEEACLDLGIAMFEWSAAQGLCKSGSEKSIYGNTTDPQRALLHLDSLQIDEVEKAFAGGTGSGDNDGGTSRRLFGAFLTWMQEKKDTVFVVGTANDLFRLPPEFLRKGRFDEIFFVDLPLADERDTILRIHLRQRNQVEANFDLPRLVAATDGFSGAEIEQAVVGALYRALYAQQTLSTEILLAEISATVPLSRTRSEDLAKLRAEAAGRFVPVHVAS